MNRFIRLLYVAEDGSINIDKELLDALEKADRLYIVAEALPLVL